MAQTTPNLCPSCFFFGHTVALLPAAVNLFVIAGSTITGDESNKEKIGSFGNIRDPYYAKTIEEQFFAPDYRNKFFYRYLAKEDQVKAK